MYNLNFIHFGVGMMSLLRRVHVNTTPLNWGGLKPIQIELNQTIWREEETC